MTMKFGPWIKHDGAVRPSGLRDDQMIEAVYFDTDGELCAYGRPRPAGCRHWERTVLYRVEQVEMTQVRYGGADTAFTFRRSAYDTHKITYTVNQDGDVLSCKMEKL